jgi:hypothetical protein
MNMDTNNIYHQNNSMKIPKEVYRDHMWLFGKPR